MVGLGHGLDPGRVFGAIYQIPPNRSKCARMRILATAAVVKRIKQRSLILKDAGSNPPRSIKFTTWQYSPGHSPLSENDAHRYLITAVADFDELKNSTGNIPGALGLARCIDVSVNTMSLFARCTQQPKPINHARTPSSR